MTNEIQNQINDLAQKNSEILGQTIAFEFQTLSTQSQHSHSILSKLDEARKSWIHLDSRLFNEKKECHQKIRSQWYASRECLLRLLEKSGSYLNDDDFSVSISHSGNLVLVCGTKGRRVGIDVEIAHRQLSEKVIEKIMWGVEPELRYSPLEVWVAKEACFKASEQKQINSHLQIEIREKGRAFFKTSEHFQEFQFCLERVGDFEMATALKIPI